PSPPVVTPSLQQWRSPSTFRGAPGEDPLKWLKEYDRVDNFNKWDDMMCLANVYFFLDEVKILGHLVSSNGVRPDPDKIKAVKFSAPKNIHDIQSFLGLCSYFRRFIKGFCYLAEPLQSLLKSGVEFLLGSLKRWKHLTVLRKHLLDPSIGDVRRKASTEIHTDASGYGIGAVLVQIQSNVEKVIACASGEL
ncbi:transposon Ty3-I Gag-Pol polyprotein, partial [Trichonephila clavipes]